MSFHEAAKSASDLRLGVALALSFDLTRGFDSPSVSSETLMFRSSPHLAASQSGCEAENEEAGWGHGGYGTCD